ncbi:FtsK/SpoIIIE family DNA translocase [Anaerotardibacter muris]|uniref:FtsK/SpoIIIE family DNA translocase n=1 Tax=Anaerotardibacter muris TaxID=2941505 RepID=UPI002041E447|nr:DNA translocase FtsK 4TM domain-containing protein [Anaerotardibacter muris]
MARTQNNRTRSTSQKRSKGSAQKRSTQGAIKGKPGNYKKSSAAPKQELLDSRTKHDIVGVVLAVLAVALFITALLPADGMVTSLLGVGLHSAFGIGAYILPFFLLAVAISYLVRFDAGLVPARTALGSLIIFLTLLTLFSTMIPNAESDPNIVFSPLYLTSFGGYCGGAFAWVFLRLFGFTVTLILIIGLFIVGILIIGFSISAALERIREERLAREEQEESAEALFARMNLAHTQDQNGLPRRRISKKAIDPNKLPNIADQMPVQAPAGKHAADQTIVLDHDNAKDAQALTRKLGPRKRKLDDAVEPSKNDQKTIVLDTDAVNDAVEKAASAPAKKKRPKTPTAIPKPMDGFELPPFDLLNVSSAADAKSETDATLKMVAQNLEDTLHDFGVDADVVGWVAGPTVTLFKVDLPSGVRVNRVSNLTDDIALALASPGVRIFAPIPGTNYVGIEVPNQVRQTVYLGDVLKDATGGPLEIAIGKDVEGERIVSDLATMPHLLIGGTTGSGKSVAINGFIMSILMRATPAEVRFIMIDPKRVEFTPYNGIPHLYVPVVTEAREAASALSWAVAEMEKRLKDFSKIGARNIGQYNAKAQESIKAYEKDPENTQLLEELPYIVIIIDELADLMMNVGKEVEFSISRLAQLARAAGIHLIVATQRPSTNVVTGLIKANITNRIAFNVASGIDSRVVLDTPGAENLIGLGDLLLSKPELAKPQRIQGCFVSEDEITAVVEHLKEQGEPEYHHDILKTNLITLGDTAPDGSGGSAGGEDPLFWDAAEIVCSSGMGSTSNLQRRLSVGYSRAGRIMDLLEAKGIVGPPNGSKPREVLVDPVELESLRALEEND